MPPRRSMLFMPATNTRAMDKARQIPADCVVFDLEDAVDDRDAAAARDNIGQALSAGGYAPRECLVRVNHPDTSTFGADISAFVNWQLAGIVIPKVESGEQLDRVRQHVPTASTALWAMIETPVGVRDVDLICRSLEPGDGLIMGTQDLAQHMKLPMAGADAGLSYSLSRCVLAARAAGLTVIDGVYPKFKDLEGFAVQCDRARQLGFDGKSVIHPAQLDVCNAHFGPGLEEISEAEELVKVWQDAGGANAGVVSHQGRMVEALHVRAAERLLQYNQSLVDRFKGAQ